MPWPILTTFAAEAEVLQQANAACGSEAAVPKMICSRGTKLAGQSSRAGDEGGHCGEA